MDIKIVTPEDLENFRIKLLEDIRKMLEPVKKPLPSKIKSSEVKRLLAISSGKLHTLKVSGVLKSVKIGGTYYYDYSEVMNLLLNTTTSSAEHVREEGRILLKNKKR